MKQVIGITTFRDIEVEKSFSLASNNYLSAVENAGGCRYSLLLVKTWRMLNII
ncbi:hypothetical protein [Clostridium saccharoperbutylacetonicum]|uniref:hypothetical protein n=1 Tax=Clostridium saccharoperbutylacetonicum TaxID=36745 RepID=UPI0039E9B345